jgi:proliferating cell nuclear antigen
MAELCLADTTLIKGIFESLREITEDGTWYFYEDHILIQEMDANNISICSITLGADDFIHYRCNQECSVTFSFKNIYKILGNINSDASIKMIYEMGTNFLTFIFKEKNKLINLDLNLTNNKHELYNFPIYQTDCTVTIKSKELKKIITELTQINDYCVIFANTSFICFSTSGHIGNYDVTLYNQKDCDINYKNDVRVKFSNHFLVSFMKISPLVEFVKLYLTNGVPIIIMYEIGNSSKIRYYLSPFDN